MNTLIKFEIVIEEKLELKGLKYDQQVKNCFSLSHILEISEVNELAVST